MDGSLTVTTAGFGVVGSSPAGISCPPGCQATFPPATPLVLTATPSSGQTFMGWSGACTGSTPTCNLVSGAPMTAKAAFSAVYPTSATPVPASYSCIFHVSTSSMTDAVTVTYQAAPPTNVPPGATFDLALFQVVVEIPASVANDLTLLGYNSLSGQVTTLDVVSDDVNQTTLDPAASTPGLYVFGPIALQAGQGYAVRLPPPATTIGHFVAPSLGTVHFTPGALAATFIVTLNGSGAVNGTIACTPPKSPGAFAATSTP
jgi:hypothetical protein